MVSRPTYQPTPLLLHASRRRPHARGDAVPTVVAPSPSTRHCTAAASHAHALLPSSPLCARHRLLLAHALLLSSVACDSSGQRTASEPAVSFGGDDDRLGRSCRRMASTRQPLPFMSSTCTLYRTLYVAYTRRRTYDVRRMALVHWPAAAGTSDYDAVSS